VLVAPGDAIGVGTITEDAAGVGVARTMRHSAPAIGDRSSWARARSVQLLPASTTDSVCPLRRGAELSMVNDRLFN
jgi:hypothetical protein